MEWRKGVIYSHQSKSLERMYSTRHHGPPLSRRVTAAAAVPGDDGILCLMAGTWVSVIGALVGSTVTVLIAWAAAGTCLGSLAAVFLVLLDGGVLLRAQPQVSLLFGVLIAGGIAFSWFQVCVRVCLCAYVRVRVCASAWVRCGWVFPRLGVSGVLYVVQAFFGSFLSPASFLFLVFAGRGKGAGVELT